MILRKLDSYMQKNKTGPLFHTIYKNKVKINLNGWHETFKLLEENTAITYLTFILAIVFFIYLHRQGNLKAKINNWDCIKLKSFCMAKGTTNKRIRKHTEWQKEFVNNISDNGLIAKV